MNVKRVLFVGATGSIGRLAVSEGIKQGFDVRALVRDARTAHLPTAAQIVEGQLTDPETLGPALDGVDAIVFTHGSNGNAAQMESVDYGAVRNVLNVLDGRKVRIVLMSALGVTNMDTNYNASTQAHDWKRRGEWLVRASGNPYTIVRPGWFDYNRPDEHRLTFLQGDTGRAGTPADGVVARQQIAQVLVAALSDDQALGKTLELVAESGAGQSNAELTPMFAALQSDGAGELDGALDRHDFPLEGQPQRVLDQLDHVRQLAQRD